MTRMSRPVRILVLCAVGLFVLCLPLFLITINLSGAVNTARLYQYGFDKYDVSEETGIEGGELQRVAGELRGYFNSGEESLQVTFLTEDGEESFSDEEVFHLKEVKDVVRLCYHLLWGSFGFLAAFIIGGFIWQRRRFSLPLAKLAFVGAALTIALLIILGIAAMVNFDWLFVKFHQLFFTGETWRLSSTDYLLRMFPEGFFNDATLFIVGAIIVEALVIGGAGLGFVLIKRKREKAVPT
jgi:integral membrane protein (TIGR01906 family)